MTAIEQWAYELAVELAKDDQTAGRQMTSTLEQRIANGLMQARAKECRHLSGELLIRPTLDPLIANIKSSMAKKLSDRSSNLEKIGLAMCSTWPPNTEPRKPGDTNLVVMP